METLRQTPFMITYLDATNKLLIDVWQEGSQEMNADDFRATLLKWKDLVIRHGVTSVLVDARKMKYMIEPELQEWAAATVIPPTTKAGLRKMASLLPLSIFEKVSVQQTIDEHPDKEKFQRKYFDDEDEAKQWLIS